MVIHTAIVDNDPELLEKLSGILNGMEEVCLCGSFENPLELLDYVQKNPVELVFSDVVMPQISGIALTARLAALDWPPKVVLMSDIPGLPFRSWGIAAFDFLAKPYTREQVRLLVKKAASADSSPA